MRLLRGIPILIIFFLSMLDARASIDSSLVTTTGNTICYDSCLGWARVDIFASTSTGPFRVIWRGNNLPGQSIVDTVIASDTIFDLCEGQYSVEIEDLSDGSKANPKYFNIVRAGQINPSLSFIPPTCHDSANGIISIDNIANAAFPVSIQWSSGPNDTLLVDSFLLKGVYSLEIIDVNGCSYLDSFKLTGPDSLEVNISGIDVTCKNACDGQALTHAAGGTAPYSYLWNNSDTNSSISSLCPGNYIVTVTDINGCSNIDSVEVTEPDSLKSTYNFAGPTCNSSCDGQIISAGTGGVRPYTYHWSGYSDTDSSLENVCAGLVTATISDANGCYFTSNINVTEPAPLKIQSAVNASTCGVCDGDIGITVSGGFGPYSYLWIGQKAEDTIATIDSLCPGTYRVAVTDQNLCSDTFDIILSDDTSGIKDISFMVSPASCHDVCDGSIIASSTGGIAPYSYLWSPGGQTDSIVTGICPGTYSLQITDASGCIRIENVLVSAESDMTASYSTDFIGCSGDAGGEVHVQVSNGIAPYNFSWTGNTSNSSNISGLAAGSYPFVITDQNSCKYYDTVMINDPDTIGADLIIQDESCHASCDGAVSVNILSGQGPFTYLWSTGEITSSLSNLCAGDYWLELSDANSCSRTYYFTITRPAPIQSNAVVNHTDCGLNNGHIKLTPTGGTGSYTYCWFDQSINDSIGRLDVSFEFPYTVIITDSLGCSKTDSFMITSKNGPEFTVTKSDESCTGECDGTISINHSNLNAPVTYLWVPSFPSSAQIDQRGGLCPGTYYVGVDAEGRKSIKEVVIEKGNEIKADFVTNNPSCNTSCDGSIVASISGGLAPYNLNWSSGSSLDAVVGLCAGDYTLTVTDAKGCSNTFEVTLDEAEEIEVELSTNNLTCYNVCDGEIQSSVSGGSAPYTYSWSTGGTTADIGNLCAGQYVLHVTDANGCTGSDTIEIGNGVPISASFNSVNADCGDCNGSLTVTAGAGNGQPYTYLWSTGDTTSSISDLTAGLYTVQISDYLGCNQIFTAIVNNNGGPDVSDTTYSTSCHSSCDGSAKAEALSGAAPYFFQWNDGQKQTGDSASALCAGVYYYSVTDANSCITFDSVSIGETAEIMVQASLTPISCPGESDGAINLIVSGGNAPYTFLWSNGDTTAFTDSLSAGTYTVTITDSTGCSKNDTFDLSDPAGLALSFDVTNTKCFSSCDGRIIVHVSGGSGPFTYLWNDPSGQTASLAAGLCAGYTSVRVTDANGCGITDSALITSPSNISVTPVLSNPTCKDGDDGSIDLSISGGTGPYTVIWNNGMNGSNISGLEAGTYDVTIIDSNQCVFTDSYLLNNPAGLNININTTPPACGNNNGSAAAVVSGGSGSYSFIWSTIPTQTNSTANNLWAGWYEVTVTDNNTGCEQSEEVILNNAGTTAMSFTIFDESCDGNCDGEARVIPGTGNFIFLWDDPSMTRDSIATNLCNGLYTVRVEDTSTSCVRFDTVRIGTSNFSAKLLDARGVDCFGDCNGFASMEEVGGMAPYQYSWNTVPPQLSSMATMLCGGQYIGTITDSLGCSAAVSANIHEPDSLELSVEILTGISCSGSCDASARLSFTGGTGPFSISWNEQSGGDVVNNLCAGQNTVSIVDANGCSQILNFDIQDVTPITDNEIISLPSCGMYDGSITLSPSGGQGPYTYVWSTGSYNNLANNLFAGIYTVTITDSKGCSAEFTYFLNNPNAPVLNFDLNTVKCNGDCNGVARVSPVGGVGPYTYIWDHVPVSTLDSLTDLCSGVYFVKVTDATGCVAFGADTITEPEVLEGSITKLTDGCGGLCEGEAIMNAIGGTMPYSYAWNSTPPQSSALATELCEGTIQVLLSDANGCEYLDSVDIVPPPALVIDSTTFVDATCFTNSDGEATVFFSGGTAPHQIQWSDGQTTQTAIDLGNGQYNVVITDTNGCTAFDTVTIGVQDTVFVTAFVDSVECIGNQTLLVAEGYGASLFNWFADSSGTLKSIGSGDSLLYTVEDSVTIYLRGQNSAVPPCFDIDTNFLVGIPPPIITASASVNPIEEGESTELLASPFLFNGSYAWSPAESLNDSASISPIAEPGETTTYVVVGTDEFGCVGSDTIEIVVVEDESIINGFSPNGDGVNDVWVIPSLEDYPNVIVEVYNRWGQQVFRSVGYRDPWDGTFEGELLPNASYYYVIDFFGNGERVETGAVTILY